MLKIFGHLQQSKILGKPEPNYTCNFEHSNLGHRIVSLSSTINLLLIQDVYLLIPLTRNDHGHALLIFL